MTALAEAWASLRTPPRAGSPTHVVLEDHERRIRKSRFDTLLGGFVGGALGGLIPTAVAWVWEVVL